MIAARKPIHLKTLLKKEEDIPIGDLYQALLDIHVYEWTEEIIPYEVWKR